MEKFKTSDVTNAAKIVFETAGIEGSRLALALDKIYQRHTRYITLEVGEVKVYLTPAEIGKHFELTARQVNVMLAEASYQYKIAGKWEALPPGKPYAVMLDVGKSYSDETPIR